MRRFEGYKEEATTAIAQLPVGSYVVEIIGVKEVPGSNGSGDRIDFQIDIAEGEHKDFFRNQYKENTNEDKKYKGRASIWYPMGNGTDDDKKTIRSFNAFTKYLADENNGFHFDFDKPIEQFKGKKIGATFRDEWNKADDGREFNYTAFAWFTSADSVRKGTATVANTKFRNGATGKVYNADSMPSGTNAGFINIAQEVKEEAIPFN